MSHIDRSGKNGAFVVVAVVTQYLDAARRIGNRGGFSPVGFGMGGYGLFNNVLIVHTSTIR
jgi:hypothetical protein